LTLVIKPIGRGYRLRTELQITGGHMERALVWAVGQTFPMGGLTWRVLEVRA
jgi:hypothetical protein